MGTSRSLVAANIAGYRGLVAAVVSIAAVAVAAAQPANNNCANASVVVAGTVNGTTVGATNDAVGTCGASTSSPDVWYSYVAPFDGTLTVSTCGGAGWDTVLGVWSACPAASGAEIGCNDDSCGLQSSVVVSMQGGVQYLIRVAGYSGATGTFTLTISETEGGGGGGTGADVIYSDIPDVAQYGPVGGIYAYAWGTATCNIGTANLRWGNTWGGTPSVGFNAYRLQNGRLLQIGLSFVKKACCAAAGSGCGIACNGVGGSQLGVGCRDVYSSGYNGSQSNLAKRSSLNPYTGAHALVGGTGDAIYARLQIPATDLNIPGALYFAEGVYVASDDAPSGNANNNASYKRLVSGANGSLTVTGTTTIGQGAIYAWRDHGLGVGVPDPRVNIQPLDIPDEGRFIVGDKVTDLGGGTWRYDYAILNINSDRAGGSLSIPIPAGVTVTNAGFHDVNYHSGEPYDNTDWTITVGSGAITWSSPQTYAQNANSNALRWGTMYNFWFDANQPPTPGDATFGLFKPHTTQSVPMPTRVPSSPNLPGDLDGDGDVDLADLAILLSDFGCTTPPCAGDINGDGVTDLGDLTILLANFGM
ncbi:MAG: hypothetical protein HZB38_06730 [Planctomycetes bacterium]|nr:hypothetical protein [Planctomycetota bacterium]